MWVMSGNGGDVRPNPKRATAVALACATATTCVTVATGARGAAWAADEAPVRLVEDGSYPGADEIYAETGIRLLRGDSHVVMAECTPAAAGLVLVQRRGASDVCFRATSSPGYLALELPLVYLVRGDGTHDLTVTVTVDGVSRQVGGGPSEWISVGEGAEDTSGPATLVMIRVSA